MYRLALCSLLIGSPAFAQMQCGGYADAVAFLSERYGEALTVQGIDGAGNVIAMFVKMWIQEKILEVETVPPEARKSSCRR